MAEWHVQDGSKVREMREEKLRRALREGQLSGLELVRPDGEESWAPLYSFSLFREEVPLAGDPEATAAGNMVRGFLIHLVAWSVFFIFFWTVAGTLIPSLFWGLGLGAHLVQALPAFGILSRRRKNMKYAREKLIQEEAGVTRSAAASPRVAAASPAKPEPDPFLGELDEVLASLEVALAEAPKGTEGIDLHKVRAEASAMHERRLGLTELASADVGALERERLEVDEALGRVTDDRTREAKEEQLRALDERISSMEEALNAAYRLEARERALLHQLEGLRLALYRAQLAEGDPPDVRKHVERVQGQLEASAEVEEHVAQARRAAQRLKER